ncbi:MAG: ABC transporter substrate-binding protein [Mariprofundaceae bacterium]|nr:ABC transporter substrate-binding protein [Mariprofundaceae bacterium]
MQQVFLSAFLLIPKLTVHRCRGLLVLLLLMTACTAAEDENGQISIMHDDTIYIGVSWPEDRSLFVAGARLAVKEANESGGILGHPVKLILNEQEESLFDLLAVSSILTFGESSKEVSRTIARGFSHDKRNIVGVIGHRYDPMAFAAAYIYQEKELPFIAPTAQDVILTTMNFDLVFRMLPTTTELGAQLAAYARAKKYKHVAVFNERSNTALEISDSFSQKAAEFGSKTMMQHSFFASLPRREMTRLAMEFRRISEKEHIDAILLFTTPKLALNIIQEFRKRGIDDIPFIGGNNLDIKKFWDPLEAWQIESNLRANIAVPTTFNPQHPASRGFVHAFRHVYKKAPDRLAAIAYDSVNILLQSAQQSGQVTDGQKTADEMRYAAACRGLTGRISHQDNGDVSKKDFVIKWLNGRNFTYRTLDDNYANTAPLSVNLEGLAQCLDHDRDDDGVINNNDLCPDDKPEMLTASVYLDGEHRGCAVDSDKDGVADWHDQCREDSTEAISKGVTVLGCPNDKDGDLVPDYRDQCINDSYASLAKGVGPKGCPLDTDGDGVADYRDLRPTNTTLEKSKGVDDVGVPLDRDGDGYPDYRDHCPLNSPEEIKHGIDPDGCALDADHDGVPNYIDQCQSSSKEEIQYGVNAEGCAQDTDGDGVADYLDACPNNQAKELEFGVNPHGCAVDRDGDAVPDYRDACANNSEAEMKLGVNTLGCPQDSDGDLVPDYRDACRHTAANMKVDQRGCVEIKAITFASDQSFAIGQSILSDEAKKSLLKFVQGLNIKLLKNIDVLAYTDDQGSYAFNLRLSRSRAQAVRDALIKLGISAHFIRAKGAGESNPIASNDTEEGRAKNRRVELKVDMLATTAALVND